jgi:hypothetical protein
LRETPGVRIRLECHPDADDSEESPADKLTANVDFEYGATDAALTVRSGGRR